MSRFLLSDEAQSDMEGLADYLRSLPAKPALRIGREIQGVLNLIGQYPYQGQAHSAYTRRLGEEVRSRLAGSYRIYYRLDRSFPEIIAILHGARDHAAILPTRLT